MRPPPQRKINVTSKSPVGDIPVVTLIRTDTTLDHSQKAEKVWVMEATASQQLNPIDLVRAAWHPRQLCKTIGHRRARLPRVESCHQGITAFTS
jgi:hypothetical protein